MLLDRTEDLMKPTLTYWNMRNRTANAATFARIAKTISEEQCAQDMICCAVEADEIGLIVLEREFREVFVDPN